MDGGASDQGEGDLATVLAEAERRLDAGNADGAVAVLQARLAQAREAGARDAEGILHAALGDVHRGQDDQEKALVQYEQAVAALRAAGDAAAEAGALLRCGDAQRALKRVGAATQSYGAATALSERLDDPRGAAHGELLLAELAAGVHREIAEKHYERAVALYAAAAEREGGAPAATPAEPPDRQSVPAAEGEGAAAEATPAELPDLPLGLAAEGGGAAADAPADGPVQALDPRPIDSTRLGALAQRRLDELRARAARAREPAPPSRPRPASAPFAPEPAGAPPPAPPPTPAPSAGRAAAAPVSLLLPLAALVLGSAGVLLIATQPAEEMVAGGVACLALAALLALLAVRRSAASTPYVSYGAASLAWLILLASGSRSFMHQYGGAERPAREAAPIATRAPAREPWTPERQRAGFERELAEARSPRQQADVLRRFGDFERQQGDRRRALELWARSHDLYREASAPGYAADMALAMGGIHLRAQRPEPARQHFAAAVSLYEEARDPASVARALRRRGEAEAALGRWTAAEASYAAALDLVRRQRDPRSETLLALRMAQVDRALGRPKAARDRLYQAVTMSADDVPMQARVFLALADFEASLDQDAAALRAYESAATLAGAGRDADLEARGVRHRAAHERRRGRLEAARGRYDVAIRLALAREARVAAGLTCLDAAELEAQSGDVLAARDFYATAEALFAPRPNAPGSARAALGLGDLSLRHGDAEGARREYARALELAVRADHTGLQIAALERLGRVAAAQEPAAAAEYAARAAALRAEAFGAAHPAGAA